jgi:hypothetical protein|tara:strand:+ start:266 stop:427 length:162 start_codon:yes stop_codon:yes gene_type:complete
MAKLLDKFYRPTIKVRLPLKYDINSTSFTPIPQFNIPRSIVFQAEEKGCGDSR